MAKDPYPIHSKDLNHLPDKNVPGSQGGVENLPNLHYDGEDADTNDLGGAKTWESDWSAFE